MWVAKNQAIVRKMIFVEEGSGLKVVLLQVSVGDGVIAADVDAEFADQRLGGIAVGIRRGDRHGATEADERLALVMKLVSLRMSAEVVVVVQNQNALFRAKR